ncbi:uncharacterized protein LOC142346298 isoform X1 [Convolutriloba macropyga]|uniref:uncharacterized protein LOC142346298 isoform X1 n=1 Tax=Convolutriloba macropyga TaxID=536237 RepID=UPI003F522910
MFFNIQFLTATGLLVTIFGVSRGVRDFTIQPDAHGCQVASAVIQRIDASQIFAEHNFMLNRLAFTLEFGKAEQFKGDDNELGGLFLITKEMFYQAQNAAVELNLLEKIEDSLCVSFEYIQNIRMKVPINSAIAIMVLIMRKGKVPHRYQIEEQAEFISDIYGYEVGSPFYKLYVKYAQEFDKPTNLVGNKCMQCKPKGTDLLFVIDSSTSLSEDQWRMQIGFVRNFIEAQKIGDQDDEMRVAFVFFSSERHIYSYDWKSQLIRGARTGNFKAQVIDTLENHQRHSGRTYTHKAIQKAAELFLSDQSGSRLKDATVNKLMIVLTDGAASQPFALEVERKKFGKKLPQVTVFAIGSKAGSNLAELNLIAGSPQRAKKYQRFNEFAQDFQDLVQMTCKSVAFVPAGGKGVGSSRFYEYQFKINQPKINQWQFFSMPYNRGSIISFKLNLKPKVVNNVDVNLKVYISFSNVVPTAQFNDFSFSIVPGKNSTIMLRPPSDFLVDVCDPNNNGLTSSTKKDEGKKSKGIANKNTESDKEAKDGKSGKNGKDDKGGIAKDEIGKGEKGGKGKSRPPSLPSVDNKDVINIAIIPIIIVNHLNDSGDGNSDYDYFEINPPELNDSIPESASVSSGATNVKQKGNSTATPNKQDEGSSIEDPTTAKSSELISGSSVGPNIPGLDDPGVGDVDKSGEGTSSLVDCDKACQVNNTVPEIEANTISKPAKKDSFPDCQEQLVLEDHLDNPVQPARTYRQESRFGDNMSVSLAISYFTVAVVKALTQCLSHRART